MKIFVIPCASKDKSTALLPSVVTVLLESGVKPLLTESAAGQCGESRAECMSAEEAVAECDMLMTIGGDGMLLKWGKRAADAGKPVIGINTGRVGFMTAVDADELDMLRSLADGTYTLSRRMMLTAEHTHDGETRHFTALNDVVLTKGSGSKLPEFQVRINGALVNRVRADGLIFSTPTGSTAYALAAGGPIIEPTVECIQMTALSAHTLLNRPMIFGSGDVVNVDHIPYEGSRVYMSVDGSDGIELASDDSLVIKRSAVHLDIAEVGVRSFFSNVGEKLMTPLK